MIVLDGEVAAKINFFRFKIGKAMLSKIFRLISPASETKVVELTKNLYLLAEKRRGGQRNSWQMTYFFTGSYGNSLLGFPSNWLAFNEFFTSKGGVYLIFPTAKKAEENKPDNLSLFSRFGSHWVVPDENEWDHIPTKAACFIRGINVKGVKKTNQGYSWRIAFGDRIYSNSKEDKKSQVHLLDNIEGSVVNYVKTIASQLDDLN